jgi:amino acid transporter
MSTERVTGATATATAPAGLRPNAVGLVGVLIQSITLIGPGVAVAFAFGPGITYAGGSFPLAIALAMVGSLLLALNIGQLAIHLPSAGGFYTYISRGLGPSFGFLTGWISIPAYLLFLPLNLLAFGFAMQSQSGLPWWIWGSVLAIGMGLLTFFGVRLSIRTLVVLGAIEVLVFTVLSVFLIAHPAEGNTLRAFTPATWAHGRGGLSGVLVGAVIGVLAFTGFESAALLAEESRNPRQIIQRALVLSVVLIGFFFILASYAGLAGYGFSHIGTTSEPNTYLGDASGTPWFTLGKRAWGSAGTIIIGLVVLNSLAANVAAGYTALSRVVFAMGRAGAIPAGFGKVHPRFRTPTLALVVAVLLTIGIAVWNGLVYGSPPKSFYLLIDTAAYCVLSTYVAVSIAVPFFYLRERRADFRLVRHLVIPLLAALLLVVVLLAQFFTAVAPDNYPSALPQYVAGGIVGGWLLLGIIWMLVLRLRKPEALKAGERIYVESA